MISFTLTNTILDGDYSTEDDDSTSNLNSKEAQLVDNMMGVEESLQH